MRSAPFLLLVALAAACGGNASPTDGGTNTGCPAGQEKFLDVCVTLPTRPAARTSCGEVTEFCDPGSSAEPKLACLTDAPKSHPMVPATVTLTGWVHPFSSGSSNAAVTVEVYRADDLAGGKAIKDVTPVVPPKAFAFDPSKATDPTQLRVCDVDPMIGCVPVTPDACKAPVCNDGLGGRPDDKKYCHTVGGMGVCTAPNTRLRFERRYAIDGVPTNTPLVIRSTGQGGNPDSTWATLVAFNVFLATDDEACNGDLQASDCIDLSDPAKPRYQLNVNALSQADYTNIPSVAGAGEITKGLGAVAGEVHDCDNVRLGNAQIGTAPAGNRLSYFNGNPFNTLPDSSRGATGTDRLGLFTTFNLTPGKVVVEAVGLVGGKPTLLGKYTTLVYPNSVSVVNVNGGKPLQKL